MPPHILWIYTLTLLSLTVMGLMVFFSNKREPAGRAFLFFTISTIVWIAGLYSSYSIVASDLDVALILFRVTYGASVLVLFSLSLFFYHFPKKTVRFHPATMWLLYGATFLVSAICIFTPLVEESIYLEGGVQVDVFGPLYSLYLNFLLFHMILAFVLMIEKLWNVKGIERRQLLYTGTGFFLFIVSALMTNVILPVWNIFIFQAEAPVFTLFFSSLVFYAIYKQRFFQFSFITLGMLRYLIIFAIFVSATIGTYYLLLYLAPSWNILTLHISSVSVGFLTNLFLEKYFPNLYSFSFRQFKKTIADCNLHVFDQKTFSELMDFISFIFRERLNIKNPRVILVGNQSHYEGTKTYKPDKFTQYLQKAKDVIVTEELEIAKQQDSAKTMVRRKMKELNAILCFPLRSGGELIGFLLLGSKSLNKAFSREEIEEIKKTIPNLEVTLMNIIITNSLQEENDIMKKVIHERTKTLKKNNKKLEKMIEQQNNFISLTAHEFRTPLTVAILGLEQISFVHKGKVSPELEEDIKTSHEQLNKLTELINRLLEIRRIDDNKIPVIFEKINVIKFIQDNVKGMNLLAKKEGVEILFKGPREKTKTIETDAVKLKEILDNLLQNAIKFSKENQQVKVTLKISQKNKKVIIEVQDHGRGIAKKDQKIIFEKFQQGSQYNQGVGIGLYLCKKYVELLEGNISVISKKGSGATFTVEIPFMPNVDKNKK